MEAGRGMFEYASRAEYVLELLNVEYKIVKSGLPWWRSG